LEVIRIYTPLDDATVCALRTGQQALINGTVYTARDAAHQRFAEHIRRGEPLPLDLRGAIIYYVGPSPAPPGRAVGAAGPTTAGRMDIYTPALLKLGLKGMIGKGYRSQEVCAALQAYRAVYFGAIGGAGALLSRTVKEAKVIAYPELGPEAVHAFVLENFPAVVINDIYGGDLYREGRELYRERSSG
jgi:fumarate hydratase subunit beta